MKIWGKFIGAFCGFLLFGPIGLILGLFIGHVFDRGLTSFHQFGVNQQQAQQAFFRTTFLVMGHIAKVDGHVSEAEIQAARSIMQRLRLNETQRQQAIHYFQQGKQTDFNLDAALNELLAVSHHNKILLRMFVEIQTQAAMADGGLTTSKQQVLQMISQRLGFAPFNFSFFEDLFSQYQRQSHQQYQHQSQRTTQRSHMRLEDAYTLLGVSPSATDTEVKRAYRRQMSQHHPDKLVSKGLPEEMIKLATEKTQKIKEAYERICEARGVTA